MDTIELRKWAENHSIESNTIKSFWKVFNNYKEEQKEEFLEVFGKDLDKRQLIIKGEYKMLFNLAGECFDDYFIIF